LGLLFIVRVAGNVIDPATLGSIEYGILHLKTPLLLIMGHEKCGAVIAAAGATEFNGGVGAILHLMQPAIKHSKEELDNKEWWKSKDSEPAVYDEALYTAVTMNVLNTRSSLLHLSQGVRELWEQKKIKIVNAIYHLKAGEVKEVDEDIYKWREHHPHHHHPHHHHSTQHPQHPQHPQDKKD